MLERLLPLKEGMQRDAPTNLSAGTPENVLAPLRTELSLVHECFDENAQRFPRGSGLLELLSRRSCLHVKQQRPLERFHPSLLPWRHQQEVALDVHQTSLATVVGCSS